MARPTRPLFFAVLAVALVATACGDDDATETTQAESPNTAPFAETTEAPTTAAPTTAAPTTTPAPTAPPDPNRVVETGDAVSVHYVGTLDDGTQFDSSRDRGQPLSFTAGIGQVVTGFDAAVLGMKVGETKTVRLEPAEAYGDRVPPTIVTVPLAELPEGTTEGQTLFSAGGQSFLVVELGDEMASLEADVNHPLAGQALTFEIELVAFDG